MISGRVKCLLVAAFSIFFLSFFMSAQAQPGDEKKTGEKDAKKQRFNAKEVIFGHVLNAHEFHFLEIKKKDGSSQPVAIPLPVILYSPHRGLTSFMSSRFEHGHKSYNGYMLLTDEKIKELGLDEKKYHAEQVVAVNNNGGIDLSVKVYDLSLTRNVVQMLIALLIFVWIMLKIAKRY